MGNLGKTFSLVFILIMAIFTFLSIYFTNPVSADTLGPPNIAGWIASGLVLISPQNLTYNSQSILLNFTVQTVDISHDFGYSIDNGPIERIANITKISEGYDPLLLPPYRTVTEIGTQVIPDMPEGNHTLLLYYGFQGNWSFDVIGITGANFLIDTATPIPSLSPSLTASVLDTTLAMSITLIVFVVVILALLLFRRHRKTTNNGESTP